jgi:bifunctional isochorismate lyase/aryl carrier protein
MAIPTIASYPMPGPADIPKSKVSWEPAPKRAVLLIHDMQEYFLDFYDVGDAPIPELLSNIRHIRQVCNELGVPVIYTAQPAEQSTDHRGLLQDMWGDGLKARPHRQPIVDVLTPTAGDVVLTKWRYSAFQRSDLLDRLRGQGRDQLIICGIYAHIGCMMTACDAFMNDVQPFFVADGLADFSLENHKMALSWVAQRCGVATSTGQLLNDLARHRPAAIDPAAVIGGSGQAPRSLEEVRDAVAHVLQLPAADIDPTDNLLDLGIDSIRIMSLVERWRRVGLDITFVELAERPVLSDWWALLSVRAGKRNAEAVGHG